MMLFITVFFSVFFGMHYYAYARIADGLQLTAAARVWLRLAFLGAALLFVGAEILSHSVMPSWLKAVSFAGMTWLGVLAMADAVIFVRDIMLMMADKPGVRYTSIVVSLILIGIMTIAALANVAWGYRIREVRITVPRLPAALNGFTIAQLSDLHLNGEKSISWLERVVADTNRLEPDLIVITGDLLDADLRTLPGAVETLRGLKAKHGVYAVTGNHETYAGLNMFMEVAREANIIVLRNSVATIAGQLDLIGIDDAVSARPKEAAAVLERIMPEEKVRRPRILLAHQPHSFDAARALGVDVQLAGHTHAGQIPPLDLIVHFVFKYPQGLYRTDNASIYTTTGTGYWGPPMRLTSRSEIAKITLHSN